MAERAVDRLPRSATQIWKAAPVSWNDLTITYDQPYGDLIYPGDTEHLTVNPGNGNGVSLMGSFFDTVTSILSGVGTWMSDGYEDAIAMQQARAQQQMVVLALAGAGIILLIVLLRK